MESFSCALYLTNFPFHGRLYLTRDRMCFSGWRDTIFVSCTVLLAYVIQLTGNIVQVASFSEISLMEKKNTALIVPNAIEVSIISIFLFPASLPTSFTNYVALDCSLL